MDIYSAFATDEAKESEGAVVFLTDGEDASKDPWIRVARMDNPAYSKKVMENYKKLQTAKKQQRLTEEAADVMAKNLMVETLADTILVGFGNLTYQNRVMTGSREDRMQLLRLRDFANLVVTHAQNVELFRVEQFEADAGN